jgi:hypothetical protein
MRSVAVSSVADPPLSVEVDRVDERAWASTVDGFADSSIYQTWPYEAVKTGDGKLTHLVLRTGSDAAAAVQARVVRLPVVPLGIAYVMWGPMCQPRSGAGADDLLRETLRAMRDEYVGRRGLSLRLVPRLEDDPAGRSRQSLEAEGFVCRASLKSRRTIVMNLAPSLDELQKGLHHKWRYHLNKARKQKLEIVEGEQEQLFVDFERIYDEMVDRKKFKNFVDIRQLKQMQARLPAEHKLRVFLCKAEGEVVAGGVCSDIGDTAIYLFGATSNRGLKTYGSYLVHWTMLAWAKSRGCREYDLNGIDPVKNPGGYQFKTQFAGEHGREVPFVGTFDAYPNAAVRQAVAIGDALRSQVRRGRQALARV